MSRQPAPNRKPKPQAPLKPAKPAESASSIRSIIDELVFVCVIIMFFRMFVVEIYKIPSGSMTPTLLGGRVAQIDVDQDGLKELLFFEQGSIFGETQPLVFKWNPEQNRYIFTQRWSIDRDTLHAWKLDRLLYEQFDRILVSKVNYMFHRPDRGDIVVFKVPESIFDPAASIYIKRAAGLPGEVVTFTPTGRLKINEEVVEQPDFYKTMLYDPVLETPTQVKPQPEIDYLPVGNGLKILRIAVPRDKVYVFGDNTHGSLDSRYWGGVPVSNIKGKAFMRIWPLTQIKMLD